MRWGRWIGLLGFAALTASPCAGAWTVEAKTESYSGTIYPEIDQATVDIIVDFQCENADTTHTTPFTVTHEIDVPSPANQWTTAILSAVEDSTQGQRPCPQGNEKKTFHTTLTVAFTREAPALQKVPISFTATGRQESPLGAQEKTTEVVVEIVPEYFLRVLYEPTTYVALASPRERVEYPVNITNLSNGPVLVTTTLEPIGKNRLTRMNPPGDQVVLSQAQDARNNNSVTMLIAVVAPNVGNFDTAFYSFRARFVAVPDHPSAAPGQVEKAFDLSVEVRGSAASGSPASGAVLLGFAFGALMLRRRVVSGPPQ